jgi:taurine transport system permease protein
MAELHDPVRTRWPLRAVWAVSAATVLAVLGLWWLATSQGWVAPLFLPGPARVVETLGSLATEGFADSTLWEHTLASLFRVFTAFGLGCVAAVPVGLLMGVHDPFRGVLDPLIEFYRPLPPLAYLPLVIIWLGIGESAKVVLIFLAVFAPICLSTRAGVRAVPREQLLAAASLGATRLQLIRHVVLPAALPEVLTGMRVGIGFGWTTLVAAEMVAAESGLGFLVLNAKDFLATDVVIAGILVIGLIAYTFDLLMRRLEAKLVPWKGRA